MAKGVISNASGTENIEKFLTSHFVGSRILTCAKRQEGGEGALWMKDFSKEILLYDFFFPLSYCMMSSRWRPFFCCFFRSPPAFVGWSNRPSRSSSRRSWPARTWTPRGKSKFTRLSPGWTTLCPSTSSRRPSWNSWSRNGGEKKLVGGSPARGRILADFERKN